jgi:hypothetical protein
MTEPPIQHLTPIDADQTAQALHLRVLEQDVTAISEMANLVIPITLAALKRSWPSVPDNDLLTAVHDAFVAYMARPTIYKPERASFLTFMSIAARGDLRNAMEKERRYERRVDGIPVRVANDGSGWEEEIELEADDDTADSALLNMRNEELGANITRLFPDKRDQEVLYLMMHRVRESDRYAMVLGILFLSKEERREIVKRTRDRIRVAALRHKAELLDGTVQGSYD